MTQTERERGKRKSACRRGSERGVRGGRESKSLHLNHNFGGRVEVRFVPLSSFSNVVGLVVADVVKVVVVVDKVGVVP